MSVLKFSLPCLLLTCLIGLSGTVNAQTCTATSVTQVSWSSAGSWSCTFSPFEGYPTNDYDTDFETTTFNTTYGTKIVIATGADVKIANNVVIDLRNSGIDTILIEQNAELHFGSNSKIQLPSGSVIVVEDGGQIIADNNSSGTYLEIGGNGIWGRLCEPTCNNGTLTGPGTATETSDPADPLPVELLFFAAEIAGNGVTLNWATAAELNSSHYVIQRSSNGLNFDDIATVEAAGFSIERVDYSYTDKAPLDETSYYRLKQVDIDGQFELFNVVAANYAYSTLRVYTYPNPVEQGELMTIRRTANFREEAIVRMFSLTGELVLDTKIPAGKAILQVESNIAPGIYQVVMQSAGKLETTRTVVK